MVESAARYVVFWKALADAEADAEFQAAWAGRPWVAPEAVT